MATRRWQRRVGAVTTLIMVIGLAPTNAAPTAQARDSKVRAILAQVDPLEEATQLNEQVNQLYGAGKTAEAIPLAERALQLRQQHLPPNGLLIAQSLNNLGLLYKDQGRLSEVEPLYQQSLKILQQRLPPDSPYIATSLNNLGLLYRDQGRLSEAEPLLQQALRIHQQSVSPDSPDIATSLNNLGLLYKDQGRLSEAEPLLQQALKILQQALPPDSPDIATSLENLGSLYQAQGRLSEAEPLLQQALKIRQQSLPPDSPYIAQSLNSLALLYRDQGRLREAEPLLQQALKIRQQSLPPDSPDIAQSLNNLAGLYQDQGRLREAEPLYQQALKILQQALPPDSLDIATSLENLALLYQAQGRLSEAEPLYQQAASIEEIKLNQMLALGSESQKLDFMNTLLGTTNATVSFSVSESSNPQYVRLGLTNLLRRKGRVLDALTNINQIIRRQLADDPQAQEKFAKLLDLQSQQTTLLRQGQGNQPPAEFRRQYDKLTQDAKDLEQDLNSRSSAFQVVNNPVSIEQVQALIPADAALVEIAQYRPFNAQAQPNQRWGQPHYAAFVLHRSGEPQVIDLGESAPIDALVDQFRNLLSQQNSNITQLKQVAQQLDAKLIGPIQPMLGNSTHLLLSPDGNLNLIPFEALVDPQGQYRLKQYDFSYLSSGRDLIRLQQPTPASQPSLIVANPNYDKADTTVASTQPEANPDPRTRAADSALAETLSSLSYTALTKTEAEGEAIHRLLPGSTLLLQDQATKDRIVQSPNPFILHIATHGFFLPNQQLNLLPSATDDPFGTAPTQSLTVNPLLRSGLALAGFNTQRTDKTPLATANNGVLTALEVTTLDLTGTQLVVLSACETGLGQSSTSEGVYGLRRALAIAGARSQVVSLWKVNDAATQQLMESYYGLLLNDRQGKHAGLKTAQLQMLDSANYSHPYYWAAFIPSGDWQPLPK